MVDRETHINYVPLVDLKLRKISRYADMLVQYDWNMILLVDASSHNTVLEGVSFNTFSDENFQKICYDASVRKELKLSYVGASSVNLNEIGYIQ